MPCIIIHVHYIRCISHSGLSSALPTEPEEGGEGGRGNMRTNKTTMNINILKLSEVHVLGIYNHRVSKIPVLISDVLCSVQDGLTRRGCILMTLYSKKGCT